MIMADIFRIVFIVLGAWLAVLGYWLMFEALFPRLVAKSCRAYEVRPLRNILVGAAVAIPGVLLGLGLASNGGPLQLVGVVILMVLVLVGLLGSTGLVRLMGYRFIEGEGAVWSRTLRGGSVLGATFLLPLIGWFIVLPLVLVSGLGVMCTLKRITIQQTETAPAPPTPVASDAEAMSA